MRAAHERIVPDQEVEQAINSVLSTNRRTASNYVITKASREAARNWDTFYKRHQDKFFKDRHWTEREFGKSLSGQDADAETETVQVDGGKDAVLLEVGCGVGNMLYPLIESNPHLRVHCCDFANRAVELVKEHPRFDAERINAFVFDLTKPDPPMSHYLTAKPDWPAPSTISVIFVLSAIPPHLQASVLRSLADLLPKDGSGVMLFRDYAYGDLSQVRYHTKKDAAWAEPSLLDGDRAWYRRGDNTFNYFFKPDELERLAEEAGLTGDVELICRVSTNRKSEDRMQRRFVQARWRRADAATQQ